MASSSSSRSRSRSHGAAAAAAGDAESDDGEEETRSGDHDASDEDEEDEEDEEEEEEGEEDAERARLQLREITQGGRTWPLEAVLALNERATSLTAEVRLPATYPGTPWATALRKGARTSVVVLAHMSISLGYPVDSVRQGRCLTREFFPWRGREFDDVQPQLLKLNAFYVDGAKSVGLHGNVDERAAMRGLGKLMLCATLQHIVDSGLVSDPRTAFLIAEADGGVADEKRVAELKAMSNDALWLYALKRFPFAVAKYLIDRGVNAAAVDPLAEYVAAVEANARLIDYYVRTYGFSLAQDGPSMAALITVPLNTALRHCAS
jgi:hypothetical protein